MGVGTSRFSELPVPSCLCTQWCPHGTGSEVHVTSTSSRRDCPWPGGSKFGLLVPNTAAAGPLAGTGRLQVQTRRAPLPNRGPVATVLRLATATATGSAPSV
jgi:hypothetical protein